MRVLTLLSCLLWHVALADIHSCGGFVKSVSPVDYSLIKVKLLTPEGHLKHEEDCNPQNGYYMIPIYNKGQYVLKVSAPEGWHFAPNTVEIKLDGVTDPCTKNEDINFSLSGFSISGVVESGSGSGPNDLPLTLSQGGKIIESTTTGEGGKYSFKAAPGKYEVATGKSTSACIARGSASVEVINAPVHVLPNLHISGYQLAIGVSNNGVPVSGASITLHSDLITDLPNCVPSTSSNGKFACNVGRTDADGTLNVPCAPIGRYLITAQLKSGDTEFQFSPSAAAVEISNSKAKASFQVAGFSARGRVVTGQRGVPSVDILQGGKVVATSDKEGYYTLAGLREGNLELSASAPKTKFSAVKTNLKLPKVTIPDIIVEGFEICGSVESGRNGIETLVLKKKDGSDSISIRPSSDGSFCKIVPPAKFIISPADASSSLTPRALDLDATAGALSGLRFTHYKTDVEARVTCIGNCGVMTLSLLMGDTVVQTAEGADVVFREVGPGQYTVRIADGDRGCWEKRDLPLLVEQARPHPVQFVQSGFSTKVILSHSAKLIWTHNDKRQLRGEIDAVKGTVSICVPVQGKYTVSIDSCMSFEPASLEITVPSDKPVEARAVDAKLSGKIVSQDNVPFTVKIKSGAGEREVAVTSGVFSFQEPLSSSGDVIIVPTSKTHLFEPPSFSLRFRGECADNIVQFEAAKGIFVDGIISPAVAGVKIVAIHTKDSNVRFEALSDNSGKFRVGPVRRVEDLSISATLDGYSFAADPKSVGKLTSVKLSKLTVTLSDSDSKERLDGVLLSVVGGKEYRSNNMIDKTGTINFVGLAPGDYFLRPILQEYKFEPSTTTITVKEGEHEHIELKGKRVAFSVMGKIREVSGTALAGLVVEGLSEGCDNHQSEATTGVDGAFRLRGLRPDCQYKVTLKASADGSAPPHCYPSQFEVKMIKEDVRGLEMIAATPDLGTDLAVQMDFDSMTAPSSYRVSVVRLGEVVSQSTVQYPTTTYYLSVPRDGAEYSVRVEADKPPMAFHAKTVFFTADSAVRVVRVPLSASRRAGDVEISFTSLMALPFFGLLAVIFFNQGKSLEIARNVYEAIQSRTNAAAIDKRKKKN